MLRLPLAALLLLAMALPASANWTRAQRAQFLDQCIASCQSTLQLPDAKRAVCERTCGCVADQTETQVTPGEMDALEEAAVAGFTTKTMEMIRSFFPACAKRATRIP